MASEETELLRIIAGILERLLESEVIDSSEDDYWTRLSKEFIEEVEVEGLILE